MKRCGDCAFTPGTDANGCEWTRIKAQLCLMAGEPFMCHASGLPQEPLCAGFAEALASHQAEHPEWRRDVARAMLEVQNLAQSSADAAEFILLNFAEVFEAVMEEQESADAAI